MIRTEVLKNITIKIGSGATPSGGQNAYHKKGISLIRSQNVLDFRFSTNGLAFIDENQAKELNNVTVEENDILLNITGDSIARVCIVPKEILPARVNQHVAIIRCNKTVDSKYVFYYLIYLKSYLLKICGVGGTRNALTKVALEKLEITIQEDQKVRAEVLSSLDLKIELNNKINAELEAMAKTIYDYWFVQFDFPNAKGKPYKTSGGEMVWNEELKRDFPLGWEVKKIGEVATVKAGGDKPENYSIEKTEFNNVPIYSNGTSKDGLYGYTNKSIINEQSVTISARGTIGFCVLRNKPFVPIIRLIALTPNFIGSAKYFYEALKNFIFENSGSVQQQLTVPQVTGIKILYPNEDVLKKFDDITSPMINRIEIIKEENQKLAELRDWLLPMLMNGQITVGDAEKMVENNLSMAAEPIGVYKKTKAK